MSAPRVDDARLLRALAELAGRQVDDHEIDVVLDLAGSMAPDRANAVWSRLRRDPSTVALRDYLAITVRFIHQARTGTCRVAEQ